MTKRSKGVRRIVLLFSMLFVIGWISWFAIASDGFSQVKPVGWVIFALVPCLRNPLPDSAV